jgi:hypothetical protein
MGFMGVMGAMGRHVLRPSVTKLPLLCKRAVRATAPDKNAAGYSSLAGR